MVHMEHFDNFTANLTPEYKFALAAEANGDKQFLPKKGEPMATGWDCRAMLDKQLIVHSGEYVKIPLGFRVMCPEGWWLKINPRSSTFAKKFLHALYGVADCHYEGMYYFSAQYLPEAEMELIINPGDAIAQIIPVKLQDMIVSEISNEEYDLLCQERNGVRGSGGFGSSDGGFIKYGS